MSVAEIKFDDLDLVLALGLVLVSSSNWDFSFFLHNSRPKFT